MAEAEAVAEVRMHRLVVMVVMQVQVVEDQGKIAMTQAMELLGHLGYILRLPLLSMQECLEVKPEVEAEVDKTQVDLEELEHLALQFLNQDKAMVQEAMELPGPMAVLLLVEQEVKAETAAEQQDCV
jgi:hypothetical protein